MTKGSPDSEYRFAFMHDRSEKPYKKISIEENPNPFSDLQRRKSFLNPDPAMVRREPRVSVAEDLGVGLPGESLGATVASLLKDREEASTRKWREIIDGLVARRNLIDGMFAVDIDVQFPTITVPQKPGWQPDGSFVLPEGVVLWNTDRGQDDKDSSYPFKITLKEPKWPEDYPKKRHFSGEEY